MHIRTSGAKEQNAIFQERDFMLGLFEEYGLEDAIREYCEKSKDSSRSKNKDITDLCEAIGRNEIPDKYKSEGEEFARTLYASFVNAFGMREYNTKENEEIIPRLALTTAILHTEYPDGPLSDLLLDAKDTIKGDITVVPNITIGDEKEIYRRIPFVKEILTSLKWAYPDKDVMQKEIITVGSKKCIKDEIPYKQTCSGIYNWLFKKYIQIVSENNEDRKFVAENFSGC